MGVQVLEHNPTDIPSGPGRGRANPIYEEIYQVWRHLEVGESVKIEVELTDQLQERLSSGAIRAQRSLPGALASRTKKHKDVGYRTRWAGYDEDEGTAQLVIWKVEKEPPENTGGGAWV